MPFKKVHFCVQGLFESSDSIGLDAIYEWRLVREYLGPGAEVRLFCERFDTRLYADVPIEPIDRLQEAIADSNSTVIYHYCDGWDWLESLLIKCDANIVVRWHNNTPPWFVAKYATQFTERTVRGYLNVLRLARETRCSFWTNSMFSARQLEVLGVEAERCRIVYPASRYLDLAPHEGKSRPAGTLKILFVSRLVPHKGHRHVILVAAYLKHRLGLDSQVIFPGRSDIAMPGYKAELTGLAQSLAVDLVLPGEVGNAELEALYREATVFLCLSEHEGFGMPIFEAMRIGLPTIVWTNTAVAEMMAGHPLACAELSAQKFAAAIAAWQVPAIAEYVLRWQERNALPRYTREVVQSQIISALHGLKVHQTAPPRYSDPRMDRLIADKIAGAMARIGPEPIGPVVPTEIAGNFVTLHDLESYRSLCDLTTRVSSPSENESTHTGGGAFLPADKFSSPFEREAAGNYLCSLNNNNPTHLIFGPYLTLRKGAYRIEHRLGFIDLPDDGKGELVFDVSSEVVIISERVVSLAEVGESVAMEFLCEDQSMIEFRIAARHCSGGAMRYYGATIAKMVPLEALIEAAPLYRPPRGGSGRFSWPQRLLRAVRATSHGQAADLFAKADQARDDGQWATAATLYAAGLKIDPENFPMWVQLGHARKEIGHMIDARKAYERALELCPDDPDVHLHIGHLLKLQGHLVDAVGYYAKASFLAPPAGDFARMELLRLGAVPSPK